MTHLSPISDPNPPQQPRSTRPLPTSQALDPVTLFEQAQASLTLAAGYAARYYGSIEPRADTARLVLTLFQGYTEVTDKVFRKFLEQPERGTRKMPARRRPRPDAVFGKISIP